LKEKKATLKKVAKIKNICVCCNEPNAAIELNDKEWICEDCAQNMNDLGHEDSLEN
jgi:ribosomal protein L37AE/L43A